MGSAGYMQFVKASPGIEQANEGEQRCSLLHDQRNYSRKWGFLLKIFEQHLRLFHATLLLRTTMIVPSFLHSPNMSRTSVLNLFISRWPVQLAF